MNIVKVIARLKSLGGNVDEVHQKQMTTSRDLQRVCLHIRDLQRSEDEQLRNFTTLSTLMDNMRTDIRELKAISGKLVEDQKELRRKVENLVGIASKALADLPRPAKGSGTV